MKKDYFLLGLLLLLLLFPTLGKSQLLQVDKEFKPGLNSNLFSVTSLSDGTYLIGGGFSGFGSSAQRACLAHVAQNWEMINDFGGAEEVLFGEKEDIVFDVQPYPHEEGGYLLVAGTFTKYKGAEVGTPIILIDKQGNLQSSFRPASITGGNIFNVHPQRDGKILVTGDFTHVDGQEKRAIARLNADGSLDTSFNHGEQGFKSYTLIFRSLLMEDGRIIVVGNFTKYNGVKAYRILQLLPDGAIDPSFNPIDVSFDWIRDVFVDDQGRFVIGGDFESIAGHRSPLVARLLPDGEVDKSFQSGLPYIEDANGSFCILPYEDKIMVGLSSNVGKDFGSSLAILDQNGAVDKTMLQGDLPKGDVTRIFHLQDDALLISGTFTAYPTPSNSYNARLVKQPYGEAEWKSQGYRVILDEDFENISLDSQEESIITIDGIRWRVRNGSIEKRREYGRLGGKQSLCLTARYDKANPDKATCFEMIDPLREDVEGLPEGFFFREGMRGQDGLLSTSGWYIAFTLDGGTNWMKMPLISLKEGGLHNDAFPIDDQDKPGASFWMKIYYEGDHQPQGQRLLIDDFILYSSKPYGGGKPTVFSALNMDEGFRTCNTTLPVLLDLNFGRGLWDPNTEAPFELLDSHIVVKLDGEPYKELYSLPVPSPEFPLSEHFWLENLKPGKHTMEVELIRNKDRMPWGPYPERFVLNFEAGIAEKECKGLAEVIQQPLGTIVVVTPKSGEDEDRLYVNLVSSYRNRRYMLDRDAALLVEDPFGFWPVATEMPEKAEFAEQLKGEIMEMDGVRVLRLIAKPRLLEGVQEEYRIKAPATELATYVQNPDSFQSRLILLSGISLEQKDLGQPILMGGSYPIADKKGNKANLFIQFRDKLTQAGHNALPEKPIDVVAVGVKNILTGEQALAPLFWRNSTATEKLVASEEAYKVLCFGETLLIQAKGSATVSFYSIAGVRMWQSTVNNELSISLSEVLPLGAKKGMPIIVSIEGEAGAYITKVVL